jgi:hypothetical protein
LLERDPSANANKLSSSAINNQQALLRAERL